jgi:tetratricopeptide (TPR) repeat protein
VNKDEQIIKQDKTPALRHIWIFRLLAVTVVPVLLFFLLELILRVAGYGFPATATIRCRVNGKDAYSDNFMFSWQFFPQEIARAPLPFIFPAEKSENTYRIFIFGASAAQGFPSGEYSFGRILQIMLREKYPEINFEVITIAMPAINSHVVLKIVEDCTRYEGDLFIGYLGNNEVVGPYGAGTIFAPLSSSLSLIRAGIAFRATRMGQLLKSLFEGIGSSKKSPVVWGGMEMFFEKQVRSDSARLQIVYQHFRRNIEDIIGTAVKNKVPVILSSVGVNLKDSPPFASLHRLDITKARRETWERLYQKGIALEEAGEYAEAVSLYLAAAEIDDTYADLQFRLGGCHWAMAEYDKARDRYIKARELDTLRFRADEQINEIICHAAGNRQSDGVYFVDAVKVFEANSLHCTTGEELFYEHAHLNFTGNYLLAKAFFERIEPILPRQIRCHQNDTDSLPTESQCKEYLAYTIWDEYNVITEILNAFRNDLPFTNQLYHKERLRKMEEKLENIKTLLEEQPPKVVEKQYIRAIEKTPDDWWLRLKYAGFLSKILEENFIASEQYRKVIEILPYSHDVFAQYGAVLLSMGNFDAAIECNKEAIRLNPFFAEAYRNLAMSYLRKGQIDKAEKVYRRGLNFSPNYISLRYNLARLLVEQKRFDEATQELNAALKLKPDSVELLKLLDVVEKANK